MNYEQVLTYLYERLPMFQRQGKVAFKKDLTNTIALLEGLGNPHRSFKSIHIAGTNGKGSSAHALASVLQAAGYKTGLYTSPHLKSFTERVRVNGAEINEAYVTEFVTTNQQLIEQINPSFFEVTVALAFKYFADQKVDLAIIETGLGGRLDSTNVLKPILSLITMIGYDHADLLGNTLEEIAGEKAGIIKSGTPVIIGADQPSLNHVYQEKASTVKAPLYFADTIVNQTAESLVHQSFDLERDTELILTSVETDITARYFLKNIPGLYKCVEILNQIGFTVSAEHFREGIATIKKSTGLKGRWQILSESPLTIADVSHNEPGIAVLLDQIKMHVSGKLHLIIGMVKDKDVESVLKLFPMEATYYFTQSSVPRSLSAVDLRQQAEKLGIIGKSFSDVNHAIEKARKNASGTDLILVCGSTFVVAEIDGL
jgi:dihydrofolate synthase/folylpolyglutamate synthase